MSAGIEIRKVKKTPIAFVIGYATIEVYGRGYRFKRLFMTKSAMKEIYQLMKAYYKKEAAE